VDTILPDTKYKKNLVDIQYKTQL